MSGLTLNLDFSTVTAKKPGHANQKHKRFLNCRHYLERKGYLNKKQGPRPQDVARRGLQPSAWIAGPRAGQPAQAPHSGICASRLVSPGVANGPGGAGIPATALQSVCQDSRHRKLSASPRHPSLPPFAPGAAGKAGLPGRGGAPPPEKVLLLSECQSGLPPLPLPARAPRPSSSSSSAAVAGRPYKCVALDCEMVGTGQGGRKSELARCSVIGYDGDLVYDKYILPPNPITDYRTRWSGIRRQHMRDATPFKLAQKEILKVLCGKIVIGHAIHNDFKALNYFHPQSMTRDTSKIPLLNQKAGFPEKESVSLKRLTKQLLHRDIQVGKQGHSSVEDARATMELYKLVEAQWEREAGARPGPK